MPAVLYKTTITAIDTSCERYQKTVKLYFKGKKLILDFGWPVQYDVSGLKRHYPAKDRLCIDAQGRNHKGCPVYVSVDDFNSLMTKALEFLPR